MNQSETGLNDLFSKWIDQVMRSKIKLPELQEKLKYYKVKLIGYHGISYDQIGSGTSNKNGDEVIKKFDDFKNSLKNELKIILDSYVDRSNVLVILKDLGLKRSSYNQKKKDVVRMWLVNNTKGFSQN